MGSAPSCPKPLPLAEEVTEHDAPYELRSLKAPVLRGFALDCFLYFFESSLGSLAYPVLGRQSGVSQVGVTGIWGFCSNLLTC